MQAPSTGPRIEADTVHLRGMAWGHRRCWGPLEASVEPYRVQNPEVHITWGRRSLYDFGEGRLDTLIDDCDLVILDHPFVGEIARDRSFHDLETLLPADDLADLAADSLGRSWPSYRAGGGQWALPIDGAAQVAAYRDDLLARGGHAVPATFDDVLRLAEALRLDGLHIAVPAIPTDLACMLISMAASLGCDVGRAGGPLVEPAVGEEVVDRIRRLVALAHPGSRGWNPIRCLDHMASTDEVAYVPYVFGYVSYADPAAVRVIRFADAPALRADLPARTILGGAGIAVSARSKHPEAAARYALHLCRPEHQAREYVDGGGQPASRHAWLDAYANARTSNFFVDTLRTLENAFLRPTVAGFVDVFHAVGLSLAACLDGELPVAAFLAEANERYVRLFDDRAGDRTGDLIGRGETS